jgi:bifunctional non-homologous end joining protein LigD
MSLDKYVSKRNFTITPEPRGKVVSNKGEPLRFFIQEHHATRLHYDFRLEMNGTLKSWAVPKGPSLDPTEKRLAVLVEDHPLDYGTFEGEIPAKQYGAGTVLLWEKGVWTPDGDPEAAFRKGHLKFHLEGHKLAGGWTLVRMGKPAPEGEKENWLLIKENDDEARHGGDAEITVLRPESVRTLDDAPASGKVARKGKAAPESGKVARKSKAAAANANADAKGAGAVKRKLPDFIQPQLATLVDKAPEGDEWLVEIKFDGYRGVARIDKGRAQIYTRAGNDWSAKWPTLTAACAALPVQSAWLDGEVVVMGANGATNFHDLQNMAQKAMQERLVYYVFDLPYLNGYDLRAVPLVERKRLLKELLSGQPEDGVLRYSDHVAGEAREAYSHACMHGMEGLVVKRADAPYAETRSKTWLKVKCAHRQEFVIGGYTDPAGARNQFGALLLGVYDEDGQLRYAGRVGTGFDEETLKLVAGRMRKVEAKQSPFAEKLRGADIRGVHWLKPALVAEVRFAEWTNANAVRHAAFMGLRDDKKARDVRRERAKAVAAVEPEAEREAHAADAPAKGRAGAAAKSAPQPVRTGRGGKDALLEGVAISHPERVLFADAGVSKIDLAQYYADVADWILPHVLQRPLMLVRCPNGGGGQCFYQKHAAETTSPEITRVSVPTKHGPTEYMMVETKRALVAMVQMGVLELHTWGAKRSALDKPDRVIFDLDPDPGVPWERVIEAAQLVRTLLDEIGLRSFVKTTGGKGLHVVAPFKPEHDWDTVKDFTQRIAQHLARLAPDRFTANMSKAKRQGRIFIDYLRNAQEATAVAAYSTRARPGAPVSVPLAWEELSPALHSNAYTVTNVRERLAALKQDPWADYFTLKQRLTAKMLKTFQ